MNTLQFEHNGRTYSVDYIVVPASVGVATITDTDTGILASLEGDLLAAAEAAAMAALEG